MPVDDSSSRGSRTRPPAPRPAQGFRAMLQLALNSRELIRTQPGSKFLKYLDAAGLGFRAPALQLPQQFFIADVRAAPQLPQALPEVVHGPQGCAVRQHFVQPGLRVLEVQASTSCSLACACSSSSRGCRISNFFALRNARLPAAIARSLCSTGRVTRRV